MKNIIPDGLYHKQMGLPPSVVEQVCQFWSMVVGQHALEASNSDRYGKITIPSHVDVKPEMIVELEIKGDKWQKAVIRLPHPGGKVDDIVIAFCAYSDIPGTALVKTVWLNRATDKHYTLDHRKYRRFRSQPKPQPVTA